MFTSPYGHVFSLPRSDSFSDAFAFWRAAISRNADLRSRRPSILEAFNAGRMAHSSTGGSAIVLPVSVEVRVHQELSPPISENVDLREWLEGQPDRVVWLSRAFGNGARYALAHVAQPADEGDPRILCSCGHVDPSTSVEGRLAAHTAHVRKVAPTHALKSADADGDRACLHDHWTYGEARDCAGARRLTHIAVRFANYSLSCNEPEVFVSAVRHVCCGALASMRHKRTCGNSKIAVNAFQTDLLVRRKGEVVPFGTVAVEPEDARSKVPVLSLGASPFAHWDYQEQDAIELATFATGTP